MRIALTSVPVDDQAKALRFYTEVLGFTRAKDIPMGEFRWLTVTGPGTDVELVLEPDAHPASKAYKKALVADGIPITSFASSDVRAECERLRKAGVRVVREPMDAGPTVIAMFDDTCGNLIQIHQQ